MHLHSIAREMTHKAQQITTQSTFPTIYRDYEIYSKSTL